MERDRGWTRASNPWCNPRRSGSVVRVLGFTDSGGDAAYNVKLSEARAVAVKAALVAAGPPPAVRFETQGLGKSRPVAPNDTESGRAKNRRVEVFIKP